MQPAVSALALSVVLLGALIRLAVNDLPTYSPADEQVYVRQASVIAAQGWGAYPETVRGYFADPGAQVYPSPLRLTPLAINAAACAVARTCTPRVLAWVETLAGIAALGLTYLVARALCGEAVGLVALALSVVSPLQLALGRRALTDELGCALGLGLAWCAIRAWQTRRWGWGYGAAGFALALVGTKETFWLLLPVLPVYWTLTAALAWDWTALPRLVPILWAQPATPYFVAYQSGAWHRPLVDMMLLAPIVTSLALAQGLRRWR